MLVPPQGDRHDLTGQTLGSPHDGALLDKLISKYASKYWHNLPPGATMGS